MAKRSAIATLPKPVKDWLDSALVEGGFGGYKLLEEELAGRGYNISKSAIHRYGQQFEERLSALKLVTEQARAVVSAAPDDEDAVNQALVRMVQEKLFSVVMELEVDPERVNLSGITRSIAELSRSSIQVKKHAAEARKQALDDAVKAVDSATGGGNKKLTAEEFKQILRKTYGA